jgi:hypothetical protein
MNTAQLRYLKRIECTFDRLEAALIFRSMTGRGAGLLDGTTAAGWPSGIHLAIDLLSRPDVRRLAGRLARRALRRGEEM